MNVDLLRQIIKKRKFIIQTSDASFGSAVKAKRFHLQLTLAQAAKNICSISYLSKVENNLIIPSEEKRLLLQERLGLEDVYMTPEHFNELTDTWLRYLLNKEDTLKNELLDTKIEKNHYGMFHKYMLSQTIMPEIEMRVDDLFQFFHLYQEENVFLIVYVTALVCVNEHLGQQSYDLIQWIDLRVIENIKYAYLYYELKLQSDFQCQKIHVIESDLEKFTKIALELNKFESINDANQKVKALKAVYSINPDRSLISKTYQSYVKYFDSEDSNKISEIQTNNLYDIIFAVKASLIPIKQLEEMLPKKHHLVYEYIRAKAKLNKDELIEHIRDMLVSQPISQYDYISVHFVLNQAMNELIERHFYKEAHLLSQKLHITINMLRKA
jgi:transcriptional regulator with XRE-family HTH domain